MLNYKSQITKPNNFGHWLLFVIWCLALGISSGCAAIKETAKESAKAIAGISTKGLEAARKDAVKKTLNYDYDTCYKKVEDILVKKGFYIYAKDPKKQMLAVYVSIDDTTEAGIFFKRIDSAHTEVEVSSPSTYAKEFVAANIPADLEEPDAQK